MTQYIEKAAVVAEIEKRIQDGEKVIKNIPSSALFGLVQAYKNILSFLDTIEVKEVDFDEEFDKFHIGMYNPFSSGAEIREFAKHFFELGLKARKEAEK